MFVCFYCTDFTVIFIDLLYHICVFHVFYSFAFLGGKGGSLTWCYRSCRACAWDLECSCEHLL